MENLEKLPKELQPLYKKVIDIQKSARNMAYGSKNDNSGRNVARGRKEKSEELLEEGIPSGINGEGTRSRSKLSVIRFMIGTVELARIDMTLIRL